MAEDKNTKHKNTAKEAILALDSLVEETGKFIKQNNYVYSPLEASKGYVELCTFIRGESISTAFSQGGSLIEAATDHLISFNRGFNEPMLSIAPWSSARSALEACALSAWLLDPYIDAKVRVQRSLAFRYENLQEQKKIARLQKNLTSEAKINQRIEDIEQIALELGFEKLVDKRKGKRTGIGINMPSITALINSVLNEEYAYRILSGIVHGQSWALQNLSFRLSSEHMAIAQQDILPIGIRLIERNLEPDHIIYFCKVLANSFAKSLNFAGNMFGWDKEGLINIINKNLSKIG